MTAVGKRTAYVPLFFEKGMWASGDPSSIPDGYCRLLHNQMMRPLRSDGRPPFVYDGLMSVANMLRWDDQQNNLVRTLAIDASQNLRTKNTNGTGFTGAVVTGSPTGRLTDYANFHGKVYQMFDNGSGVPAAASVYDGNVVSTSPFTSPIVSRAITSFIERLFLLAPRVTITNICPTPTVAYLTGMVADVANWRVEVITNGAIKTTRFTPKSPTDSALALAATLSVPIADSGNATTNVILRWDMRNTSGLASAPMQVAFLPAESWGPTLARALNHTIVPAVFPTLHRNGYRYRCIVAGTTGGAEPTWPTTSGGTVVDGSVTWINDGPQDYANVDINLPADGQWYTVFLPLSLAQLYVSSGVQVDLRAGNASTPSLATYIPVDIAMRDSVADGDPSKKNYGLQVTAGDFYYPFFNAESTVTATVNLDSIVWTEIDQPSRILAKNNYTLPDVAGLGTAAAQVAGRYIAFKRRGFWVFRRTTDKNVPIMPEQPANTEVGCIGPRAWDTFGAQSTTDYRQAQGDTIYFIGENGVYRMGADWNPQEIAGDAMREEIMARGANWVESQSTYNVPFLVIEHANKEVWVYTQKGKVYVYHIPSGAWSTIDVSGSPEIRSMFYDYAGQRMLVSFGGYGLTRLDETSSADDTIDNTVTPLAITNDIISKPIELFSPRFEACCEEIGVFHLATASQTGQTISVAFSLDRGKTWTTPSGYPAVLNLNVDRNALSVGTLGPTISLKITRVGAGGAANWSVSKLDAKVQAKRGELPWAAVASA